MAPPDGRSIEEAGTIAAHGSATSFRAVLVFGGLAVQGVLLGGGAGARGGFLLLLFLGLAALGALRVRRGWSVVAGSAALGGLGMLAGQWLDGGTLAHCQIGDTLSPLASWSGGLMILGCSAACLFGRAPGQSPLAATLHHLLGLAGMTLGMLLPLWIAAAGIALPEWAAHPAMLAGMALLGGLAHALPSHGPRAVHARHSAA